MILGEQNLISVWELIKIFSYVWLNSGYAIIELECHEALKSKSDNYYLCF